MDALDRPATYGLKRVRAGRIARMPERFGLCASHQPAEIGPGDGFRLWCHVPSGEVGGVARCRGTEGQCLSYAGFMLAESWLLSGTIHANVCHLSGFMPA